MWCWGLITWLWMKTEKAYFGCVAGRYANRIARGSSPSMENPHQLATNDGPNHLHGGLKGFDKVMWEVTRDLTGPGEEGLNCTTSVPTARNIP